MQYTQQYSSPLGGITLGSDGEALTGLWFDGQRYFGDTLGPEVSPADLPVFHETRRWLDLYFSGAAPDFTPPLRFRDTPFRELIWALLLEIPWGQTVTYGALAVRAARKMGRETLSAQAVGGAVGRNPISLIVPCHRVVGAGGTLNGYAGGVEKKEALLRLERGSLTGG